MPNYQNGKIYVLKRTKDDKTFYVGSTVNPLSKRLWGHRDALTNKLTKNNPVYKYINKKGGKDAFYIELYKRYPCDTIEELRRMEGRVIVRLKGKGIKLQNKNIAGRTKKETDTEYHKTEKYKAYRKKYDKAYDKSERRQEYFRQHGKKRRAIIVECECGRKISNPHIAEHKKSAIHKRLMAEKENQDE